MKALITGGGMGGSDWFEIIWKKLFHPPDNVTNDIIRVEPYQTAKSSKSSSSSAGTRIWLIMAWKDSLFTRFLARTLIKREDENYYLQFCVAYLASIFDRFKKSVSIVIQILREIILDIF